MCVAKWLKYCMWTSHGSELVTHCDKVLLLLIPWETRLWLKGLSL